MDERIVEGMDGGRRDERNARMEEGRYTTILYV